MATRHIENHYYSKLPMTPPRSIPRTFTSSPFSVGSSSASPSDTSSWRNSGGSSATEFEDVCSISDNNSEIVPLKVSDSVKKLLARSGARHGRPPSLSIPSPMAWSTIGAPQDSALMLTASTIPSTRPHTPNVLTTLPNSHSGCKTPRCNTPSLDSSYNSAGVSSANSPSTPISQAVREECWDSAVQLQAKAMDVLFQLSPDFQHCDFGPMLDPYKIPQPEMVEHNHAAPRYSHTFQDMREMEPLSAISIPSPGGFFASLGAASQKVWGISPNTAIVTESLEEAPSLTSEEVVSPDDESCAIIAEAVSTDDESRVIVPEAEPCESPTLPYDANIPEPTIDAHREYEKVLHQLAASNTVRTKLWLIGQETYLTGLLSPYPVPERTLQFPSSPALGCPRDPPAVPSTKKTVHFVTTPIEIPSPQTVHQRSNPLLYHTFQYLLRHSHQSDVYMQSHSRLATLQTHRMHLPSAHTALLRNTYSLPPTSPCRTKDSHFLHLNPASTNMENDTNDVDAQRRLIANGSREREMLQQVSPALWQLEAWRAIHGGSLLVPAAQTLLSRIPRPRILDICASGPAAGWGWSVAVEHRHAQVSTVVPHGGVGDGTEDGWKLHREPSNHFTVPVRNIWRLPFAEDSFDVISARSLHILLHDCTDSGGVDEWKAALEEIYRVLAPNGVFQFSVMDAEVKINFTNNNNKPYPPTSPLSSSQALAQKVSHPQTTPLPLPPPPPQQQQQPQLSPQNSPNPPSSHPRTTPFTSLNTTFLTHLHALNYKSHPIQTFPHLLTTTANFLDAKHARLELPLTTTATTYHNHNHNTETQAPPPQTNTNTATDNPHKTTNTTTNTETSAAAPVAAMVGLLAYESWVLAAEDEMLRSSMKIDIGERDNATTTTTTCTQDTSSSSSSSSSSLTVGKSTPQRPPTSNENISDEDMGVSSSSPPPPPHHSQSLLPQIALAVEGLGKGDRRVTGIGGSTGGGGGGGGGIGGAGIDGIGGAGSAYVRMLIGCARKCRGK